MYGMCISQKHIYVSIECVLTGGGAGGVAVPLAGPPFHVKTFEKARMLIVIHKVRH